MASRVPSGLARIPLWKRNIPDYPLFYKGDPKRKVFLPLFWMKVIPPKERVPKNYVHFIVHPQMSKVDIKNYLQDIYKVPVLSVRTEIRTKNIEAHHLKGGHIQEGKDTIWREQEKYAYVQMMPSEIFTYPDYLKNGAKTKEMSSVEEVQTHTKEMKQTVRRTSPVSGLPEWFIKRKTVPKS